MRATARVFAVDPYTVLQWWVEAAEQLQAFARSCLCDVHVRQGQLDALSTVLRAVQDGALGQDEAIERLSRSSPWVWAAMDPESTLLLTSDGGNVHWRWPRAWCIRWPRGMHQTVSHGC